MRARTIEKMGHPRLSQSGERVQHVRLERQRGLKSFLTWAFFLAQASAAEQLLTGAAKAQQDEPSDGVANRSEAPPRDPSAANATHKSVDGAGMEAITSPASSASTIQIPPLDGVTSIPHFSSFVAGAPHIVGAAGGNASGPATHARVGSSGSAESSLPRQLPDHDTVDQVAPPVSADTGLTSQLGFDLNVDVDGLISTGIDLDLGNVVGGLGDLLVTPLREVTEIVDTLTDELGSLLNGTGLALGETLDSVLDLSELTGLNLTDGLSGLLSQGITESSEQDGERTPSASGTQTDELFVEGQYTNYNIALRDSVKSLVDVDIALTGESTSTDAAPSEPPQTDQPPDSAIVKLLPFDELDTRPAV